MTLRATMDGILRQHGAPDAPAGDTAPASSI